MTQSKSQQERQWKARKEDQKPHGKVESFAELGRDVKGKNNENR